MWKSLLDFIYDDFLRYVDAIAMLRRQPDFRRWAFAKLIATIMLYALFPTFLIGIFSVSHFLLQDAVAESNGAIWLSRIMITFCALSVFIYHIRAPLLRHYYFNFISDTTARVMWKRDTYASETPYRRHTYCFEIGYNDREYEVISFSHHANFLFFEKYDEPKEGDRVLILCDKSQIKHNHKGFPQSLLIDRYNINKYCLLENRRKELLHKLEVL